MLRDSILTVAQDPSCLMCITPWEGGGWFSPVGGMVQPSATPRNFATENAAWYDCQRALAERVSPGDDFTVEMDVEFLGTPAYAFFGGSSLALIDFYTSNQTSTSTSISFVYYGAWAHSGAHYIIVSIGNISVAKHTFKVKVHTVTTGRQRIDVQVDGGAWTTGYAGDVQSSLTITSAARTAIDGYIHLVRITNDTTGKMVWSYPNEAERLRLITKTNVRTDRGVFEPALLSAVTRIKTAIDLRGNASSLTLICKAYIPSHTAGVWISGLVTQGDYIQYTGTVALLVRENRNTGEITLRLHYVNSNGVASSVWYALPLHVFDRWAVFAAQFDYERSLMLLFVDGIEVARQSGALTPFGQGGGRDFLEAVSIMHNPFGSYLSEHKIAYAMMFRRALPPASLFPG